MPRKHEKSTHSPSETLADFTTDLRVLRLSAMAIVIGAASALVATVLLKLIGLFTNLAFYQRVSFTLVSPANNHLGWFIIAIPAVGGLCIGLIARFGSEKIRGHGIPEAIEAILIGKSKMDAKVAILKPIASAIAIGTGGPFGAEGPIIMTGGAFGSLFAQYFRLSSAERRTLLVAGAAGGMAAVFSAPIAAILLAVELLLFEWRPRSFIPVAISCITAATLRIPLLGAGPVFPVLPHAALSTEALLFAAAAGIVAGFGSAVLTSLVYWCEDAFHKLPIHWMWWPIIGGIFVGIGGLIDPRVLGVGYDTIHSLLQGNMVGSVVLGLLIGKALVWAIALGSGTSGGVLAPLLIMGGALGALEAQLIPVGDASLWAMISMAAIMGGTMRSPLTAIIFTLELTHDFNILPGLAIAAVAAETVTVLVMKRSILTEKIARRGLHLTREYSVNPANTMFVRDTMQRGATSRSAKAGDASRATAYTIYPEQTLQEAAKNMVENNTNRLVVIDTHDHQKVVGYIERSDIFRAWEQLFEEEDVRERHRRVPLLTPRRAVAAAAAPAPATSKRA